MEDEVTRLERVVAEATAEIDRAYWAFTRTAGGVPPALAVPDAYRRRAEARRKLRRMRSEKSDA